VLLAFFLAFWLGVGGAGAWIVVQGVVNVARGQLVFSGSPVELGPALLAGLICIALGCAWVPGIVVALAAAAESISSAQFVRIRTNRLRVSRRLLGFRTGKIIRVNTIVSTRLREHDGVLLLEPQTGFLELTAHAEAEERTPLVETMHALWHLPPPDKTPPGAKLPGRWEALTAPDGSRDSRQGGVKERREARVTWAIPAGLSFLASGVLLPRHATEVSALPVGTLALIMAAVVWSVLSSIRKAPEQGEGLRERSERADRRAWRATRRSGVNSRRRAARATRRSSRISRRRRGVGRLPRRDHVTSSATCHVVISSSGFRVKSGTVASACGNPTGRTSTAVSFLPRLSNSRRNPVGVGVCVSVTSPM